MREGGSLEEEKVHPRGREACIPEVTRGERDCSPRGGTGRFHPRRRERGRLSPGGIKEMGKFIPDGGGRQGDGWGPEKGFVAAMAERGSRRALFPWEIFSGDLDTVETGNSLARRTQGETYLPTPHICSGQ